MNQGAALTTMILSLIPFPGVYNVAPFLLQGIHSILGWVGVAFVVLAILFMLPFQTPAVMIIVRILWVGILATYIAGLVYTIPNYLASVRKEEASSS